MGILGKFSNDGLLNQSIFMHVVGNYVLPLLDDIGCLVDANRNAPSTGLEHYEIN